MIHKYHFNFDSRSLQIEVLSAEISAIRNALTGIAKGKAIPNTTKLYIFLQFLNDHGVYHVSREELAYINFSKHYQRMSKAIEVLEKSGLLESELRDYESSQLPYYRYYVKDVVRAEANDGGYETLTYFLPYLTCELINCRMIGKPYNIMRALANEAHMSYQPYSYLQPMTTNTQTAVQTPREFCSGHSLYIPVDNLGKYFIKVGNSRRKLLTTEIKEQLIEEVWGRRSHTGPVPDIIKENEENPFFKTFTSWYNELVIDGSTFPSGHISYGDGRFYHTFHLMKSADRKEKVLWDGKHVTEVWDANCSFFATIGYYLNKCKRYASDEERKAFMKEANKMIDKTIDNTLYSDIQDAYYYNGIDIDRDRAKVVINSYRSLSRDKLFRKDGNYVRNTQFIPIDKYFQERFPHIRNFFLDYPRRLEIVKDDNGKPKKDVDWSKECRTFISYFNIKTVSNLQREVLPYELNLISLGICRELYEVHGIKSITVHDAIYMKVSDAKKKKVVKTIQDIYVRLLGLKKPEAIPLINDEDLV